jgi:hypothetical protein
MLLMNSNNGLLRALLEAAPATTQPSFVVGGITYADTTTTPYANDGAMSGVSLVTLGATPSSGEYREITSFTIYNEDTASVTVQIKKVSDAGTMILGRFTLPVGATLSYAKKVGFRTIRSDGSIVRTRSAGLMQNLTSYYHVNNSSGISSCYASGQSCATALGTVTVVTNTFYARPFQAPYRKSPTVDQIGAWVTTGVAATGIRLGIYSMAQANGDFTPGNLLYGSADIPTTGSASKAIASPNLVLTPGQLYWAVLWANGGPTVRSVPVAASLPLGKDDSLSGTTVLINLLGTPNNGLTYGSLPAVFPPGPGLSATAGPAIFIRYSA